jgi:hypothetical protein
MCPPRACANARGCPPSPGPLAGRTAQGSKDEITGRRRKLMDPLMHIPTVVVTIPGEASSRCLVLWLKDDAMRSATVTSLGNLRQPHNDDACS